jgi:carbon-monoxide dehydrogenase large subunit
MDAERLRVVTRDVGGSFGMKAGMYTEYVLVLWAAKRTGRPVKWVAGRSESFVSDTHGRDIRSRAELALDADGRMLALRVESIANLGAYPGPRGPMIGVFAHPLVRTCPYDIGAASYRGKIVYTNTNSVSPYRGSGQPEAALLLERLVDKAARRLGLAPRELRRRNLVSASRFPYTTALGTTYDSGDYAVVLDKAARLADLDGFEQRRREAQSLGRLRGIGIAAFVEVSGGVPVEWGSLRIGADRRVEVTTGIQNIGTGHETTFPQIVAERLGVSVACVTIRYGDTQFVKKGAGTHASRSTLMAGTVLSRNMDAAILRGTRIAAHVFGASDEAKIRFLGGRFVSSNDGRSLDLFEVVQRAESDPDLPDELRGAFQFENDYLRNLEIQTASNGCHVCEVEIDPETGQLDIVGYVVVDDVGTVVNPIGLKGQIHGGVAQGIGNAFYERLAYDENGQLLNGTFMDYHLPTSLEVPRIETGHGETLSPLNAMGVKGAGEAGAIPVGPLFAQALEDALHDANIEILEIPLNSNKLWALVKGS